MGKGISLPSFQIFTMERRTRGCHGGWVHVECGVVDFRTLAGCRGLEALASGELDPTGTVDPPCLKPQGNMKTNRHGVQRDPCPLLSPSSCPATCGHPAGAELARRQLRESLTWAGSPSAGSSLHRQQREPEDVCAPHSGISGKFRVG